MSDRLVLAGKSIAFNVEASDSSTQRISFGLHSVSAPGAKVDSVSGAFQWQVPSNQPAGVCTLQFLASDNGLPPLTNTLSINLQVVTNIPPPEFLHVGRTGNSVFLDWQAVSGATYVVEEARNLDPGGWTTIHESNSTDGFGHISDLAITSDNRFYRVRTK